MMLAFSIISVSLKSAVYRKTKMKLSLLGFLRLQEEDTIEEDGGTITDKYTRTAAYCEANLSYTAGFVLPHSHTAYLGTIVSISLIFKHSLTTRICSHT